MSENALKVSHVLWAWHEKTMNGLQNRTFIISSKKGRRQHPKEDTMREGGREGREGREGKGRTRTNEN